MRTQAVIASALAGLICGGNAWSAEQGIRVELDTEMGEVVVEVFPKAAPLSACDFLAYVDAGLYEGATFYRVVRLDNDHGAPKIEVVQGGLQDETRGRPPIAHESTQMTGLKHVDGALSLARGEVGTGGAAAFFVAIGAQPALDHGAGRNKDGQGFAVFGRVVRGMDVIRRIHQMKADGPAEDAYLEGQMLAKPIAIKRAKRLDALPQACATLRQ